MDFFDSDAEDDMDRTMYPRNDWSPLRSANTESKGQETQSAASESDFSSSQKGSHPARTVKRKPAQVPWDPYLWRKGDLVGNAEQCGCGNIFIESDTFCHRCGNRRAVEVKPLPLHVSKIPEPPHQDVGERMIAWHEAYTQRRQAMQALQRQNQEVADVAAHHGTPHITPLSHDLAADLQPIRERYKGVIWMKEFALQRERDRLGKEKTKEYTLKPEIHERSKSMQRNIQDLYKHKKKVETRLGYRRQAKRQKELAECTFHPEVGHRRGSERDPVRHQVHDRLYRDASHRRNAEEERKKESLEDWKLELSKSRSASPLRKKESAKAGSESTPRKKGLFGQKARSSSPVRFSDQTSQGSRRSGGPRASQPVLAIKQDLEKLKDLNSNLDGSRIQMRKRPQSAGAGSFHASGSLSARSGAHTPRASSRDAKRQSERWQQKAAEKQQMARRSVNWTGGTNTVSVTTQFHTLLEKWKPPDVVVGSDSRRRQTSARFGRQTS